MALTRAVMVPPLGASGRGTGRSPVSSPYRMGNARNHLHNGRARGIWGNQRAPRMPRHARGRDGRGSMRGARCRSARAVGGRRSPRSCAPGGTGRRRERLSPAVERRSCGSAPAARRCTPRRSACRAGCGAVRCASGGRRRSGPRAWPVRRFGSRSSCACGLRLCGSRSARSYAPRSTRGTSGGGVRRRLELATGAPGGRGIWSRRRGTRCARRVRRCVELGRGAGSRRRRALRSGDGAWSLSRRAGVPATGGSTPSAVCGGGW